MRYGRVILSAILRTAMVWGLVIAIVGGVFWAVKTVSINKQQARCQCLASQPYINTKWNNDRCLVNVTDYNDTDLTLILFVAMEYCR